MQLIDVKFSPESLECRVYLGVRTCELFLCFVPFVLLGAIVLTAPFLYYFLCFTSPVSFTGSYVEDEPECRDINNWWKPNQHRNITKNGQHFCKLTAELQPVGPIKLRLLSLVTRWFCRSRSCGVCWIGGLLVVWLRLRRQMSWERRCKLSLYASNNSVTWKQTNGVKEKDPEGYSVSTRNCR